MQRYRWKGNIRELRNTVERLIIMTGGDTIDVADLPGAIRNPSAPRPDCGSTAGRPCRAEAARGCRSGEGGGTLREFKDSSSAPIWSPSFARTAGTSRRPPRSSTRPAATSTRSSSSTRSRKRLTARTDGSGNGRERLRPCRAEPPAHPRRGTASVRAELGPQRQWKKVGSVPRVPSSGARRTVPALPYTGNCRSELDDRSPQGERKVRTPQGSVPGNARSG